MPDIGDAKTFQAELDQVFRRHNELVVNRPEVAVALLINMADTLRDKFNCDVEVEEVADGKWLVTVDGDEVGALLGFERDQETGDVIPSDLPPGAEVIE